MKKAGQAFAMVDCVTRKITSKKSHALKLFHLQGTLSNIAHWLLKHKICITYSNLLIVCIILVAVVAVVDVILK